MIKLELLDKHGYLKRSTEDEHDGKSMAALGKESAFLATKNLTYEAGDFFRITANEPETYIVAQLDETLPPTLLFLKEKVWEYTIALTERSRKNLPYQAFKGARHYSSVRYAREFEKSNYQNLSWNPHDQKEDSHAYPHAYANVETREDATFFAKNAIDGIVANNFHGSYPYQSWGINQQKDAMLTIDFGREVIVDEIAFVLRADFPHDSYWEEVTVQFSNQISKRFLLKKETERQYLQFEPIKTSYLTLMNLKKAPDDSPFPALTQLEVFGKNNKI